MAAMLILSCFSCAFAQDWIQWRGNNRDGKVTGFSVPKTWPDELTQKWKVVVGQSDATPALTGNRLYVFARQDAQEVLLCLNADDGKELWRNAYEAQSVTGPAAQHPGPRSSPVVADGKVVTLGVAGILSCINAETGKTIWRKDEFPEIVPQFFTGMSPIIVDGMCIAHLGGPDNGVLMAFDLNTGKLKWKWEGDGPAYGSPVEMNAAGTKQVVAQTEKNIVGITAADGKLLWQIPTPTERRFFNSASPVVDGQTVFYTGQGLGTRAVTIEKKGSDFAARELWNNELGTAYNTPVLKDGMLYGLSHRGNLFCINAENGKTAWADTARYKNFAAVLDVGSVILALLSSSELVVFEPSSKEYHEIARFKVSDVPTYAHPVIAGKRIYVKDQDTVAMWIIE
jgi:outer membrane protein assembly factor BamB